MTDKSPKESGDNKGTGKPAPPKKPNERGAGQGRGGSNDDNG